MTMDSTYDIDVCNKLKDTFHDAKLHRPMRVGRYDAGTRLTYRVTGIENTHSADVHLEIDKFVGGGFAGQVYRVKVLDIQDESGPLPGIETGGVYAMKILIPPSGFSLLFRNLVYRIGFQGPFQLQCNPAAARAGALWQKFIRRGAQLRFEGEQVVNDIHATFVDSTLGSCGELSDWVDGRTWQLEVDDRMDLLKRFKKKKKVDPTQLGSPEFRTKKKFMADFVKLLHDMGAPEFARQYEWSTCKSQPNCLKRTDTEDDPYKGLLAVDFRAGLCLLPLLPMSPGDVMLIFKGLGRGSLVQFDRGSIAKLEAFIKNAAADSESNPFAGMEEMLEELKTNEAVYRSSVPDITHNHVRLLYSRKLWSSIGNGFRTGWKVRNFTDEKSDKPLRKSSILTFLFCFLGLIPILGSFFRKIWARADWRKHYGALFSKGGYMKRALRGKVAEKAIKWHRDQRVTAETAAKLPKSIGKYFLHLPLSVIPVGLHRFFTQWEYFKERLHYLAVRPLKLYFSNPFREQWLRDMIAQGREKRILSEEDAKIIDSQIKEPYIQKYLKSLAVHVCTLPVTQVVSIIVSWIYVKMNPQMTGPEAVAAVTAILVLFQVTPISPGSLVRGLYVVYMMIRDRSFKDYNIAVFLGFFKYIGYLAFPIQMTYRYPELARFMAGHWATEAVHVVPVFGESGALLEHWIFGLFYNWPLTVRRRMRKRAELRATQKPRYWHVWLYTLVAGGILAAVDFFFFQAKAVTPVFSNTWWIGAIAAIIFGSLVTRGCGGASLAKRFVSSMLWGIGAAVLHSALHAYVVIKATTITGDMIYDCFWRIFLLAVIATFSAVITELKLKDPDIGNIRSKSG